LESSTYQRWRLDLRLTNTTGAALELGNDLCLVESSTDGSLVDGVLHRIGHPAGEPVLVSSFGLSNFDVALTDGRFLRRQGNRISVQFAGEGSEARTGPKTFGRLGPAATTTFTPTLAEGVWLNADTLASLRIVLPEVQARSGGATLRFRPVAFLSRPTATASSWNVSRLEVLALEPKALAAQVATAEANPIARVFAANWLSDIDPQRAGPSLIEAARPVRQGLFLACALELLARLEATGLEEHALALLDDTELPNGIRARAARYLGAVKAPAALASLERVAGEKDDVTAGAAVDALADLGGAEARAALQRLAGAARGQERRRLAREALERLDRPPSPKVAPLSTPPAPI